MSKTYSELMQEIDALTAQAEQIKRREIAEVIERIKHAISVYGLKPGDLGFARPGRKPGTAAAPVGKKRGRKPGASAAKPVGAAPKPSGAVAKPASSGKGVKFRDGNNVWGGRGPRPRWLREALAAGKSLKDFAV